MEYLSTGVIIDTFSLDGTLKIKSSTNQAEKRYRKGNKIFLVNPQTSVQEEATVISYRSNKGFDYVRVEEISSPEEALSKKGYLVQVSKNNKDLAEGEYFFVDLIGCDVIDSEKKTVLGTVKEVEEFPAQITLRVRRTGKEDFFVPFIDEFIRKVDIEAKQIDIHVMKGML